MQPRAVMPSNSDSRDGEVDVFRKLLEIEYKVAHLEQSLAQQNAGTRNQTLQLLIAGVVTCVTAVIGARVTAPTPPPTQTIVQTSTYDRALEACKLIQTDTDRAVCILTAAREAAGVTPR